MSKFSRDIPRELRFEISTMVFLGGLVLTIFAVNRYLLGSALPGIFEDIDTRLGEWMIWVAVVGGLVLLIGGWYFVDTIRKRREFGRLVETDSKAKFVRNRDRAEELAYRYLGKEYVGRYEEKRKEFGLR